MDPFAPVTVREFRKIYPEFAGVGDGAIAFRLNLCMKKQNKQAWQQYWREAVILDTAHRLALRYNITAGAVANGIRNPNAVGFATSLSASPGSLSQSATVPAWMTGEDELDSFYGQTLYGQEYLVLLIEVIPPVDVVISPQIHRERAVTPGYRSIIS